MEFARNARIFISAKGARMRNKEFKRLNKAELLEVIYRFQLQEQTMAQELESWKVKATERYEKLENSGNIAEAALSIHGFFTAAQNAAKDYVRTVCTRADEKEQKAQAMLQRTYDIANDIHDFLVEVAEEGMGLYVLRGRIEGVLDELAAYMQAEDAAAEPTGEET